MESTHQQRKTIGIWYAVAAFSTWGVLPIYWKVVKRVPADQILSHRILWSFFFCLVLIAVYGQWGAVKEALMDSKKRMTAVLGAILISANWFIYIWAVNSNHIVDASMGYYINPLFSVFLGVIFLRERLSRWQTVSIIIAALGVLILAVDYGRFPWIALSLALTFGLYGLVKKLGPMESLTGLVLETAMMTPLSVIYLLYQQTQGNGAFGHVPLYITLMLMGAGIVTATPLLWFAKATNRVPLSTVGFIQYLSPTFSLIIGITIFHEVFMGVHWVSFGLIWLALILFSFSGTRFFKELTAGESI